MKQIYILAITLLHGYLFSQSPGGVGEVNLWLKTDSDKTPALFYTDYSGNQHYISSIAQINKPKYTLLNYNEALDFDGNDDYLKIPYLMETLDKVNLFTVYQNYNLEKESAIFTSDNSGEKELFYGTANLFRYNNEQINYIDVNKVDSLASFSLYSKFDIPSKQIKEVLGNSGISSIYVGKDVSNKQWQAFKGKLPEFFIYRKILTQNERDRVNSYLAVKYGITMPFTEYLNSKSKKIWQKEDYTDFPNNIAGIARDDCSGLYQKQATSTSEDKRLVIAAKELALNNKKNEASFGNQTFLIWGNDKNPLELDKEEFGYQLLKRKWKTRFYTESGSTVSTEVVFKIKDVIASIPTDKTLWLLIDKTGQGNFNNTEVEAYPMDALDNFGNAHFKNVIFDKDLSGTDVFGFAVGSRLLSVHKLTQPTCKNTSGTLDLNIKGGKAPYQITLKGNKGSSQTFTAQSSQITLANLSVDSYTAEIKDATNFSSSFAFNVTDFNNLVLDLGQDLQIKAGEYAELDASKSITDNTATYQWTSDNGFTSSSPKVKVYESGEYTVTVTTSEGCTKTDKIKVTKSLDKGIVIYPNPTAVGNYFTIRISLEKAENIDVKIFDASGRLIKSKKDSGKSYYEIKEYMMNQGAFVVMVTTETQQKAFKLIIN